MASSSITAAPEIDYPIADGQPMAETPVHRQNLTDLIAMLEGWYAGRPDVYVSGNMFVYYVEGNRNRHLAPDVFVVLGVPNRYRDCYKTWEEPKRSLDVVFELTSRSTQEEDFEDKFRIYRDELRVSEYFLFDPHGEYLDLPEQGYRLVEGRYVLIEPVAGRIPSEVLGLHLERSGRHLRLYDPATGKWLATPKEHAQKAAEQAEQAQQQAEQAQQQAEQAEAGRLRAELENETLRQELEALKRRLGEAR